MLRAPGDAVKIRLRLSDRHARLQQTDDPEVVAAAIVLLFSIKDERRPHLAAVVGVVEVRGHHAHHSEGFAVQRDRLANDIWVAAEMLLPETVLEYYDLVAAGFTFFW